MTIGRRIILGVTAACAGMMLGLSAPVHALDIPPAPSLERPIVDQANVLSPSDIDSISRQITESRSNKDYQMGVLVIPTLGNGEYLEGYALKVARQWGIGTDAKDNGVLLLVVVNDHKVRIEVGRGLEGDLTDVESGRIIRSVIAPEFRSEHYGTGITKGIQSIQAQVEGKADPNQATIAQEQKGPDFAHFLFLGFWILPWLGAILARSKSWWAGGIIGAGLGLGFAGLFAWATWALIGAGVLAIIGFIFDFFVSKNYRSRVSHGDNPAWWAGGTYWGGGGSSGGGGGGFGGGDFGGGGASGDW